MKRVALIGHRGVGKTSLLKRIEHYFEGRVVCLDLDAEIAARTGREVSSLFAEGEAQFRAVEREVFASIEREIGDQTQDVYLAVGAGFGPSLIGPSWQTWWIRRVTDESGRIFTDRPRLNAQVSALDEYRERYESRQRAFAARADEVLSLEEGAEETFARQERAFVRDELRELGGILTVIKAVSKDWIARRIKWGITRFELRDDLLSIAEMEKLAALIPSPALLISFRDPERRIPTEKLVHQYRCLYDGPLEGGFTEAPVLSLHERRPGESIADCLARFPASPSLLKAALPVHDFNDLETGHRWQMQDPERRSFLPHSPDGRWSWYRCLMARRQPIDFFREGDGSGRDQPTLLEWANAKSAQRFAAVLGDPVRHSRTPLEHRLYFEERDMPVYAIRVTEDEMRAGALSVLNRMGLSQAAVTSPLKTLAYSLVSVHDQIAERLQSVNTIDLRREWSGLNTDLDGLRTGLTEFLEDLPRDQIAVWGGGGTLEVIREVLPQAQYYSIRTGRNRDTTAAAPTMPRLLVWAAPRSRGESSTPPAAWRPEIVFDLNYAEDSPGRAYAVEVEARYVSGLAMFRAQAAKQREFWSANDERR